MSVSLSENQLRGEIPPELGDLSQLESLWVADNNLVGELPPELGELADLRILSVAGNPLVGEIPESFLTLELLEFSYGFTEICVPDDERFTPWLDEIQNVPFEGEICLKYIYLPTV